jgi:hypothetical protein
VQFMGRNTYVVEVTAFEPLRRIELTARQGPLKPTLTHTFEQTDGATRYQRHVQIPLHGMFRLVLLRRVVAFEACESFAVVGVAGLVLASSAVV